jgi:phospholipid/cholesterol/gamma-HCH transport system ATP-binding protein
VRDLVVGFGDASCSTTCRSTCASGEILGVVGGSGSGKSVLLRTIIGLLPKRGTARSRCFGRTSTRRREPNRARSERRWGILFQQGALFSSLTVRQNVQFPMREYLDLAAADGRDGDGQARDGRAHPDDADKFPAELSGGMTKRVALARALALDPEIVFLDEPTSGLDPISAASSTS